MSVKQIPDCPRRFLDFLYKSALSGCTDADPKAAEGAIAGASTLADVQTATDWYKKNSTISSTARCTSFFFQGRMMVIPEITVFVQEQPIYVPIGTTIRQLLEGYSGISPTIQSAQNLQLFQGSFRPRCFIHEGVDHTPSYAFMIVE